MTCDTLEIDEMTFKGRWDAETDTVTFLPIQYAEHPSGERRWKAPEVITRYDPQIHGDYQGSFDRDAKENLPACMGVRNEISCFHNLYQNFGEPAKHPIHM